MQNGAPLGHNFANNFQGQPQQGTAYGMPQQSSAFPPGASSAVGVGARFTSAQPGMPGLVAPRPGATGGAALSAAQASVGPQRGVGLGGMPGAASRVPPGGAVMNGSRGQIPMATAPASSMGLTVGGAPVVGSGTAGRPGAVPSMGGYSNPSGEIMAMLMKGGLGAGALGTGGALTGVTPKIPGAVGGTSPLVGGEDHDLPNFGAEDFPALGGGLGSNALAHHNGSEGMSAMMQGGMIGIAASKLPQDFQMASEDFPALPGLGAPRGAEDDKLHEAGLPGAHLMQGAQASQGTSGVQMGGLGGAVRRPGGFEMTTQTKGGVPPDRFGLLGLLSVIQMTNPDLNTLALGTDLTTLGLNLNSTESLYSTFASPWADGPSRREPEFSLPMCYYMQPPTLKSGHIQKFQLETLFYIFYMLPKDTLQAVAASELYSRDWKFHRDLKMWFHKQPNLGSMGADGKSGYSRPNTYIYFDVNVWERRTYYDANKNLEQGFLSEEDVWLK